MAYKVVQIMTVVALAAVAASQLISLPNDVTCVAGDNTCQKYYAHSHCEQLAVCKYGDTCRCNDTYAAYRYYNYTYSCRPATLKLGANCGSLQGNTCMGSRTYCNQLNETYGVCACNSSSSGRPYKPNADGTDCVPLDLGADCSNTNYYACGVNAFCNSTSSTSKRCSCKPGYKQYDNSADCTHYAVGEACPVDACDFPERHNGLSCGYGTCESGTFQCTPGTRWWQYSARPSTLPANPSSEQSYIMDGQCLENYVLLVGSGEACDSIYQCRSGDCTTCPEQNNARICSGAQSVKQMTMSAVSVLLLLACSLALNI